KLGPGWLCHPKFPPGAILFDRTHMSDARVALIFELHGPTLALTSKEVSLPIPYGVGVTSLGGVAATVDAYTATPTAAANEGKTNLDLISPPSGADEPAFGFSTLRCFRLITKRQNV